MDQKTTELHAKLAEKHKVGPYWQRLLHTMLVDKHPAFPFTALYQASWIWKNQHLCGTLAVEQTICKVCTLPMLCFLTGFECALTSFENFCRIPENAVCAHVCGKQGRRTLLVCNYNIKSFWLLLSFFLSCLSLHGFVVTLAYTMFCQQNLEKCFHCSKYDVDWLCCC